MNVRVAKEWEDLKAALDDSEFISVPEYVEILSEMAQEIVTRLEAARVDLESRKE